MFITNPTAITFCGYLLLMIVIGFIAWHYTRDFNDYILGGRSLGGLVTALSVGASDMSGWLLMGLPGAVFLSGISESWLAIGLLIGSYLNWKLVAARLRVYTEKCRNALTLPDYLTHRFEDKERLLSICCAIVILIFFTIYSASGMVAGARLFENTFDLDYSTALWLGAAATITYVFVGGFLAVSWTDTIQAAMMCIALIVTPFAVMYDLGGWTATIDKINAIDPSMIMLTKNQTLIGVASLMAWGLGYCGQPHILVRFMATKSISVIPGACRAATLWMVFCLGGAICVGFFGSAYFAEHINQATLVVQNPERVFIVLSQVLFNPWIAGILMSAILAAVMSTLSCQLLVCSSTLTEDLYRAYIRPQAGTKELVWVGRLMVLGIAVLAIFIAMDPNSRVLSLVSYAWAGFGGAFGPVIVLSLWYKGMTRNGALAGMIVGAVTVIVWYYFAWFGLYEIIPAFIFNTITILVVSAMGTKKPTVQMQETFDEVVGLVKAGKDYEAA